MTHGPIPPHERPWRHPSELPAPTHEPTSRTGRVLIASTATVGLVLVGFLALSMTPNRLGTAEPTGAVTSLVLAPFGPAAGDDSSSPAARVDRVLRVVSTFLTGSDTVPRRAAPDVSAGGPAVPSTSGDTEATTPTTPTAPDVAAPSPPVTTAHHSASGTGPAGAAERDDSRVDGDDVGAGEGDVAVALADPGVPAVGAGDDALTTATGVGNERASSAGGVATGRRASTGAGPEDSTSTPGLSTFAATASGGSSVSDPAATSSTTTTTATSTTTTSTTTTTTTSTTPSSTSTTVAFTNPDKKFVNG